MKSLLTAFILLISLLNPAVAANKAEQEQAALNAIYGRFIQAFAALDAAPLADIYADDVTYVPEQPGVGIVKGKQDVLDLYQKFFDRVKKRRASLEVDFRVVERLATGKQNNTEICYYMVRFHPPQDTEEPVSEFAGKLVMILKQDASHHWRIMLDMSSHADTKYYYDATPHPNLYYGEQFSPLAAPLPTDKPQDNVYQHNK